MRLEEPATVFRLAAEVAGAAPGSIVAGQLSSLLAEGTELALELGVVATAAPVSAVLPSVTPFGGPAILLESESAEHWDLPVPAAAAVEAGTADSVQTADFAVTTHLTSMPRKLSAMAFAIAAVLAAVLQPAMATLVLSGLAAIWSHCQIEQVA